MEQRCGVGQATGLGGRSLRGVSRHARWWRRVPLRRRAGLLAAAVLFIHAALPAQELPPLPVQAEAAALALPSAPTPQQAPTGSLSGTVVDNAGGLLPGARVRAESAALRSPVETSADKAGRFHLAPLPAGTVTLTVLAPGFAPVSLPATVPASADAELGEIAVTTVTAAFEVDALTPHEIAALELRHEEQQRLFGVVPNFGVVYDWKAPPLDAGQKFHMATRFVIDPYTFAATGLQAALEQSANAYPGFGRGMTGYWKRFGAATADVAVGNELGGAVFPVLFHQDPRYFWKGTGSVAARTWYALTRAVICRGDNGRDQFSYSGIVADLSAGAISNLYYPAPNGNRGVLTVENAALAVAFNGVGNVVQEFVFKFFTPNSRHLPPNTSGVPSSAAGTPRTKD